MNKFKTWWRNLTDTRRQAEINRLVTRSGRRCARDLNHAIQEITDPTLLVFFNERARLWREVFWDSQLYRDSLYHKIDQLEADIEHLENLLKQHGITDPKRLPF